MEAPSSRLMDWVSSSGGEFPVFSVEWHSNDNKVCSFNNDLLNSQLSIKELIMSK